MTGIYRNRFEKLLAFLKTLKREQFNYSRWVTEYDYANKCGTVCCAAGWLPQVFPKEWAWIIDPNWGAEVFMPNYRPLDTVEEYLQRFFGMNNYEVYALFYGDLEYQDMYNLPIVNSDGNLEDVIKLFEVFLSY